MNQTSDPPARLGLVGLGVMGANLALNLAEHGATVRVHDRDTDRLEALLAADGPRAGLPHPANLSGARSLAELVTGLERPRCILLSIRAGAPVDAVIDELVPHLATGDLIVDGGNSHPDDSERRAAALSERGLLFVGMGISGGEDGARHGPSLMPGGPVEAYERLAPTLRAIAAQVPDGPCVTHVGPGGAGHFVKTVHNGIEYADMQLIAETYDLLRHGLGLDTDAIADVFARWDEGAMHGFLTGITARILRERDPRSGEPLVDRIVDKAGQKGTGRWTCELALAYGVPAPTIQAAVAARALSALKDERVAAAERLSGPADSTAATAVRVEDCHDALYASKICSYAQGLALIETASRERGWNVDLSEVARIWKGGCIIRARVLDRIQQAFAQDAAARPANLLVDPELAAALDGSQRAWRDVVGFAAGRGIPVLAIGSSLAYYDSYRRATLPQNLTQAQRDLFGAHTFERVDGRVGEAFHHDWSGGRS